MEISTLISNIIIFSLLVFTPEIHGKELTRRDITTYLLNPERYDSNTVPDFDEEHPTNVTIQISIHNMHSVSEAKMIKKAEHEGLFLYLQEYSINAYLRMWWRDERLDFSRNSSISKLELDPKKLETVWQPDIFFENEKSAYVHTVTTTNKLMHITTNGTVIYITRLSLTLKCTMLLHYYPFDSQRCPIYVQSFGYTIDNINLAWHAEQPVIFKHREMAQFTLDVNDIVTKDTELPYSGTGTFSTLKAELVLNRKVGFYFLQVFVPSILLVVLSWVSFWVDANAVPARVSLGVTCVLTMTTQSSGIQQSLPPVSYAKAIDIWMFVCLLFVFAALLEFAYVNVLQRQKAKMLNKSKIYEINDGNDQGDIPANHDDTNKIETSCIECLTKRFKRTERDVQTAAKRVDIISRTLFPLTFALFLVIFFIVGYLAPAPKSKYD